MVPPTPMRSLSNSPRRLRRSPSRGGERSVSTAAFSITPVVHSRHNADCAAGVGRPHLTPPRNAAVASHRHCLRRNLPWRNFGPGRPLLVAPTSGREHWRKHPHQDQGQRQLRAERNLHDARSAWRLLRPKCALGLFFSANTVVKNSIRAMAPSSVRLPRGLNPKRSV